MLDYSGNTSSYGGEVYGGTFTGYASDPVNGNVVENSSGVADRLGHSAYTRTNNSATRSKDTTIGPEVNLSFDGTTWSGDGEININEE